MSRFHCCCSSWNVSARCCITCEIQRLSWVEVICQMKKKKDTMVAAVSRVSRVARAPLSYVSRPALAGWGRPAGQLGLLTFPCCVHCFLANCLFGFVCLFVLLNTTRTVKPQRRFHSCCLSFTQDSLASSTKTVWRTLQVQLRSALSTS